MKKIFSGILICVLPALTFKAKAQDDFNFKVAPNARTGEVVIKGKIGNIGYPTKLKFYMGGEDYDTIPVRNGVFEIKKTSKLPAYGALVIEYYSLGPEGRASSGTSSWSTIFFEEGTVEINSTVDTIGKHAVIKAGKLHGQYKRYWSDEGEIVREQRKLAQTFNEATPEQLQSQKYLDQYEQSNKTILNKLDKRIEDEIRNYPQSYATLFLFSFYLKYAEDRRKVQEIFSLFPDAVRNSKYGAVLKEGIAEIAGH